MDPSQFHVNSPGKVIPVTLNARRAKAGIIEPVPVGTWAFIPEPLPPQLDWQQLKLRLFDKLLATSSLLARLDGLHRSNVRATPLLRALWLREAKLSSAVEDIFTTALDMVLASRVDSDVRSRGLEAWRYVRALEHGVASPLPMSVRLIKEMHKVLLEGLPRAPGEPDPRPGEFRDIHVLIGSGADDPASARFVPPPPGAHLERCLSEFEKFVNATYAEIPPLVAIALSHYQFEAIHPFRDGNGRIGRVIVSRSLVSHGLLRQPVVYLSGHIYKNKAEYNDRLLRVSTHGEWAEFVEFMLDAIATQALDAEVRTERLVDLRQKFVDELNGLDAPGRLHSLVDRLFHTPAVNATEAREILNVDPTQVYRDLAVLERAAILTEVTGKKRGRDWIAKDILAVIDDD